MPYALPFQLPVSQQLILVSKFGLLNLVVNSLTALETAVCLHFYHLLTQHWFRPLATLTYHIQTYRWNADWSMLLDFVQDRLYEAREVHRQHNK